MAIAPTCGTCDPGNSNDGAIHDAVDRVLNSNNVTAKVDVQQHLTATGLHQLITSQQLNVDAVNWANLDPVNSNAQWTVISITSPFQFNLPFTKIGTINISTHVQMLEEQ